MRKLFVIMFAFLLLAAAANAASGSYLIVKLVSQNPDPVEPGDSAELRFMLENNGSSTADNLQVELLPQYPISINEPALKDIGSLDVSQSSGNAFFAKYRVLVDASADEGSHAVYLRYRMGSGVWTRVGPFYVDVQPSEAVLAVVSASSESPLVSGKVSDYVVNLRNFGKSFLKDIQVRLDLSGIPFSPVGSSNEKVISSLAAGASGQASFRISPDASADSGNYKTFVILNYVDDSGVKYVRNATIGLPVYNEPSIDVSIKESTVFTVNANGNVVLSISNSGPSAVRFMTVKLLDSTDYRIISAPEVYVGNLEADDFETAEFSIRTGSAKKVQLGVEFSYRDSRNSVITENSLLNLNIYPAKEARQLGLVKTQQNLLFVYLSFGVQIIILAFLLFMLVDCWKNSMPRYKKALWIVIILTGIGSVIYYLIARRKR